MFPKAPDHMFSLRDKTVNSFGYDTHGDVEYSFNSLGYRSTRQFNKDAESICVFGNTISFGLGVAFENTYAELVSKQTGIPAFNFSWGCHGHTNLEQLDLIEHVLDAHKPRYVIFQINNLDRVRINKTSVSTQNSIDKIKENHDVFIKRLQSTFSNVKHCFLYWDDKEHNLPMPDCLIDNRYFIESKIAYHDNEGKKIPVMDSKSHKIVSLKIIDNIKDIYG